MARAKDAAVILAGGEPDALAIHRNKEDYRDVFIKALNWYSANKDPSDARKYLIDGAKAAKREQSLVSGLQNLANDATPTTTAWCLRLLMRGAVFNKADLMSVQNRLNVLFAKVQGEAEVTKIAAKAKDKTAPVKTVQDYMQDKIRDLLGEMEGRFDEFIANKYKVKDPYYNYFVKQQVPAAYMKDITEWAEAKIREFGAVLVKPDDQLKEGYSNFTRAELVKVIKYFDDIKADCVKYGLFKKVNKAPRKRKAKPPSVQVAKLKYKKEGSVSPIDIIEADQLWTYIPKTRVLTVYRASGASGLAVKGSSIINFDTEASEQKKLRKPEVILEELKTAGKVPLRKLMDKVTTKGKVPNGRINAETVLYRVVK